MLTLDKWTELSWGHKEQGTWSLVRRGLLANVSADVSVTTECLSGGKWLLYTTALWPWPSRSDKNQVSALLDWICFQITRVFSFLNYVCSKSPSSQLHASCVNIETSQIQQFQPNMLMVSVVASYAVYRVYGVLGKLAGSGLIDYHVGAVRTLTWFRPGGLVPRGSLVHPCPHLKKYRSWVDTFSVDIAARSENLHLQLICTHCSESMSFTF